MDQEIERKFIIDPSNPVLGDMLSDTEYKLENRYYLYRENGIELRFTSLTPQSGEAYYNFDRMEITDNLLVSRKKDRISITEDEFERLLAILRLKDSNIQPVVRKSYLIAKDPQVEIKVYGGRFEGLIRAEVEFDSVESSNSYQPLRWFGKEISNTLLGDDTKLPDLSTNEFEDLMKQYL